MPDPQPTASRPSRRGRGCSPRYARDERGPWLPEDAERRPSRASIRYGMHSGIGGLAHVLAEIRLTRDLTAARDARWATRSPQTLCRPDPGARPSTTTSTAWSAPSASSPRSTRPGAELAVARLARAGDARRLAGRRGSGRRAAVAEGRVQRRDPRDGERRCSARSGRCGTTCRVRPSWPTTRSTCCWPRGEERPTGLDWPFVPLRFVLERRRARCRTGRTARPASPAPSPRPASRSTDPTSSTPARLRRRAPASPWPTPATAGSGCRTGSPARRTSTPTPTPGATARPARRCCSPRSTAPASPRWPGRTPYDWERACLHSLQVSGIPERRHPGFWDNDGRCCGTAGVGDVVPRRWQRHGPRRRPGLRGHPRRRAGRPRDPTTATTPTGASSSTATADPLLPPGVGWMQGAAGIAAYLFRLARVLEHGRGAPAVARMDTWWSVGHR